MLFLLPATFGVEYEYFQMKKKGLLCFFPLGLKALNMFIFLIGGSGRENFEDRFDGGREVGFPV